ncbi:nickel pincer cofactor biosynthesis protein LarB [Sulfitobacter pseudonitzschiae]|uniref:Nickel pincer cofactor biosynthesis protein LarB n=1 Tax=Pseudosulfitobacter pseudonitzschiae TaxID=1402135 RepID=A0A9Q2NLP7_9RHOB|nr:nickel pincer cofactor biosynthesis protein LarB [Pseudosulfitobacter pseudonitzschiae]MBM2294286.1 nickel pincer cofactor biosynthesis protein LarB [Pseudosulfitobacter pseudonitzschiae]MBM2299211.1 nickel pincer cofactor biosynthesis protein LarB [Pseudosulfitobacter pseudonitzschiae]MBM2304119.1 nickel pincer cofactor biosynthesis protein LarB [Pseudosulfitobacter pseudonitzschiae]MBM2313899.1 nickel pincer cofactor biosynthesis protein LarB [Pseudosulfitobacter pseudonitzschiae]MBM23188
MSETGKGTPKDGDPHVTFDRDRAARIGIDEAVLCGHKTDAQVAAIIGDAVREGRRLLLTRLDAAQHGRLPDELRGALDYCALSRTGILGALPQLASTPRIALVSAGTSDAGPMAEAQRVLAFAGLDATAISDVGVAGLWRLLAREEQLRDMDIVIVFAGMDAALPSVLAGLVPGVVIGVPTSVGYGVATGGRVALDAMLASCAAGVTVVNIDNGYGAATAAVRLANMMRRAAPAQ